jgi:hypothetical protein
MMTRHRMPYPLLAVLMVFCPVAAAEFEPAEQQQCPPDCQIEIQVPSEKSSAPVASPITLIATPDQQIELRSNHAVQVIFPEQTPFADKHGRPVYTFNLRSRRASQMQLRDEAGVCDSAPGCKYIVIDRSEPGRPPLDPYIIIDR